MKNDNRKSKSKKNVANNKKATNNSNDHVEHRDEIHDHDVDFERVDEDASFKLI